MPQLEGLGALSVYMTQSPIARSLGRQWPPVEWGDAEAGADPGTTISGLSDTGVSPGRRFQPLILGLAVVIWALTHSTGHDSRDPSGLTLAHQPAHSSASGCDLAGIRTRKTYVDASGAAVLNRTSLVWRPCTKRAKHQITPRWALLRMPTGESGRGLFKQVNERIKQTAMVDSIHVDSVIP